MQNEKLKKFTDFFVKYRRYFCAAVLFVILVVILVKCTGPQKDQKETQNGTPVSYTHLTLPTIA